MNLSEEDKKVILAIHNSREAGWPPAPDLKIPQHLFESGLISKNEEGAYIPDEAKWKLLQAGIALHPRKWKSND